ncbi:MAG: sigma-70 family RNA polymerase sigma factor [Planctomycetota bacterium]|nr:sigma-70 family RNA polymerase sigma factor [Planctomycetota bacterium]
MVRFQTRLDTYAFDRIVSAYMKPAVRMARQILSDRALAEDAVQESFLRVIRKRDQYIPASPFSCWFYTIVRNVCLDMLHKLNREKETIREVAVRCEPKSLGTDMPEIPELLNVLARSDRDVLVFRIVHGLGFRDVAAALGISEEAAKKRAQRALRRLRARIHDSKSSPGTLPIAL